jgi:glycerate-2-kinase
LKGSIPLKNHTRRHEAADIFRAALSAVDPYELIRQRSDQIRQVYADGACDRMFLASFGKAAAPMTKAVSDFAQDLLTKGILITKYRHAPQADAIQRIVICEAAHPVPDDQGVLATQRVMDLLKEADRRTLVVCLISGGGSALLVAPHKDITLAQKQQVTQLLLEAGADIRELNTVRKHISRIKGGRLAELAYPARILSLILSDVIDDPLDVIASGPTSPDQTTFQDALDVVQHYNLTGKISENVLTLLKRGAGGEIPETPKEGNPAFDRVENIIVGSNRTAIASAKREAMRKGYKTTIVSSTLQGEARQVGIFLAQEALTARQRMAGSPLERVCLISGGETTVTVGGRGLGGRNMELALAFAKEMKGASGITLLSAGTDGTDGPTDAAGAFADAATLSKAADMGLAPDAFLHDNDSYHFFKALNGLFVTGPTGTNVMDIQIVLIDGED